MNFEGSKLEAKSDLIAERHKLAGNREYSQQKYDGALKFYNKALCYAESQKLLSLIYGNRSIVYLELKKFEECLDNIQMAKAHNCPEENLQQLIDREEICKQLLAANSNDDDNKFKLSYPPNPKIPFIVEHLEIRRTKEFGRGIYATVDMKANDVISIETPIFASMSENGSQICCILCFRSKMLNLIPCLKSASFMFCSETCRNKAYEMFPNIEVMVPGTSSNVNENFLLRFMKEVDYAFGGHDELMRFVRENSSMRFKKTVFDYDFTDPSKNLKNKVLSSLSLIKDDYGASSMALLLASGEKGLNKFLKHLLNIVNKNNTTYCVYSGDFECTGLLIFGSLFNHSCWPNVSISYAFGRSVGIVLKEVKAGEQLFFNYIDTDAKLPREQRLSKLNESHSFVCKCYMCCNNLTPDLLSSNEKYTQRKLLGDLRNSLQKIPQNSTDENFKMVKEVIQKIAEMNIDGDDRSMEAYRFQYMFEYCLSVMRTLLELPLDCRTIRVPHF